MLDVTLAPGLMAARMESACQDHADLIITLGYESSRGAAKPDRVLTRSYFVFCMTKV